MPPITRPSVTRLSALLLLLCATVAAGPVFASSTGSFVWLSDVHFDPFYAPTSQDGDSSSVTALLEKLVARTPEPTWKDPSQWHAVFASSPLQKTYNARGSDANDAVFQEVLLKASLTLPSPDFVLVTGDLLGHDFGSDYYTYAPAGMNNSDAYRSFVAKTLEYLALSIRNRFPQPPIVATLGNNDAYCGDYDVHLDHSGSYPPASGSTFLPDTAAIYLKYFLPNLSVTEQTAFKKTFPEGGYFTLPVPQGGGSRFLVVNSIPFMEKYPCEACHCDGAGGTCVKCHAACGSYPDATFKSSCAASPVIDAAAQMNWLTAEAGKAGAAWVVAHVPPGKGCYSTSPNWTSTYLDPFRNLFVGGKPANVAGTLAAHSHMASFKLVRDTTGDAVSSVLQAPSIGSNHSNNPAFGVLSHDRSTLEIRSYQIWSLDLSPSTTTWSSYPFAGLSGPITATTLDSLYTQLGKTERPDWDTFQRDYGSRAPICPTSNCNSSCVCLGDLSQTHLTCLDSLD